MSSSNEYGKFMMLNVFFRLTLLGIIFLSINNYTYGTGSGLIEVVSKK